MITSESQYRAALVELVDPKIDPRRYAELREDIQQANLVFEEMGMDWYAIVLEVRGELADGDEDPTRFLPPTFNRQTGRQLFNKE